MTLSDQALTTVERVQRVDGFARLDTTLLEDLIEEASAEFVALCGRTLHRQTNLVERVKGYGTELLFLRGAVPIVSIGSVVWELGSTSSTVDSSHYSIEDATTGALRHNYGTWAWTAAETQDVTRDQIAGTELRAYKVTYTGGYITPQQALDGDGTRDLPHDIERAVLEYVKTLYFGQARDTSMASRSTPRGSQSVAFNTLIGADPGLPLGFTRVANRYKLPEV